MAKELQTVSLGKIKTGVYHAGISDSQKESLHKDWRNGNIKVVCATIGRERVFEETRIWLMYIPAFGLGIDKADVRFVLHYSVSLPVDLSRAFHDSNLGTRRQNYCLLFYYR